MSKLNAIAKAKKFFVSETGIRFCAIDSQISFLALAIASKKTSVKLAQSGSNLEQSVKLGVKLMDDIRDSNLILGVGDKNTDHYRGPDID